MQSENIDLKKWYQEYRRQVLKLDQFQDPFKPNFKKNKPKTSKKKFLK
jgi:hypothetical protein